MTNIKSIKMDGKINVTNAEFLSKIFQSTTENETLWTCSFYAKPDENGVFKGKWGGSESTPEGAPTNGNNNNYFCVSSLIPDGDSAVNRDQDHFGGLYCVVLDDIEDLTVKPTWKIETSPGNFQAGYALETPVKNVSIASRLHNVLTTTGMLNNDKSGNNPVRYVRLPVGSHTKYEGSPECKLVIWNPSLKYELGALLVMMGLNPQIRYIMHGESTPDPEDPFEDRDPFARIPEETLIRNVINGDDYHDSINRLAAKWVARGMTEHQCVQILKSTMMAVDDRSPRWRERFEDIGRSVATAFRKYAKVDDEVMDGLVKVNSMFSTYKPVEWVVDGLLAWGITVMAGAPGVGKTSQIVSIALLVAGVCEPDHPLRPSLRRKIVYVTEDALQVESILVATCKLCGYNPADLYQWFHIYEARRMDPKSVAILVAGYIKEHTSVHSSGFPLRPLTVLDTSSAVFALEDENSNSAAAGMIAEVKQILNGAPLWLVAHTPKSLSRAEVTALTVRGAGAFEGDANATAFFFKDDEVTDKRFMKLGKVRYTPEFDELMFTSEVHSENVMTPWGDPQTIRVRISYPEQSSAEEREIYVESAKDEKKDENMQEVKDAIITYLNENGASSKNKIEKSVVGKAITIRSAIAGMVAAGVLGLVGKGPNSKVVLASGDM